MGLQTRFKNAWNAFNERDPTKVVYRDYGPSYSRNPYRISVSKRAERSVVAAVVNRIAVDVASIELTHCKLDESGRFMDNMDRSTLNTIFHLEANTDQNAIDFMIDVVESMFDEGVVAVVPVLTEKDPDDSTGMKIYSLRTGRIKEWYPQHIKVELYDERDGRRKDLVVPKSSTAIIPNPFYEVFNETNSTVQRLLKKLYLLDVVDTQTGSGKLDLLIQLPYPIRTEAKRKEAAQRKAEIENQIENSKLGIAYIDGTEKVTQLNRSIENNLLKQVEYLQDLMFSQLGITQEILNGNASEETMQNYYARIIEPIISVIALEYKRKFLSLTAIGQRQSIEFYRDPFKLAPIGTVAELSDKMTRNEILTSNEVRQGLGMKPSKDPSADELRNKNLSEPAGTKEAASENQNGLLKDDLQKLREEIKNGKV
jgi:hypothetical protein